LIRNANHQVRKMIRRIICANVSDIIHPDDMRDKNSLYRVHALVVVVHTSGHVVLDANDVYVHDISYDPCHCCSSSIRLDKNPKKRFNVVHVSA